MQSFHSLGFCLLTILIVSCVKEKGLQSNDHQTTVTINPTVHSVSGNIIYSGDDSLLKDTIITVRLNDVSLMDVASITLGKTTLKEQSQFPISFSISYDPSELKDYGRYSVSARIEKDGKLLFINDTHVPVFDKHQKSDPNKLVLPVIKVN